MPTYEVQLDDGRKIHIDADDQNAALAGAQHFLNQNSPQASPSTSGKLMFDDLPKGPLMFDDLPKGGQPTADDLTPNGGQNAAADVSAPVTTSGLAKAAGAGAVKGAYDLPGDMVSLINLARRGLTVVRGGNYDPSKDDYSLGQGYEAGRRAVDNLYTPQNTAEDWTKYGAEFLPALATGPEGLAEDGALGVAKVLAKRAATQAALPAAASSAAGAVTQGTAAEPYARAGAALLAGGLGAKGATPEPLTAAKIGEQVNNDFSAFRSAPVTIKPDVVEAAAKGIQNDLTASGLSKAPANDIVAPYIGRTTPVSLNELQETRTLLGKAAKQSDTPEGVAAIKAKQNLDSFMGGLTPADAVVGGNALPQALADLQRGRTNAAIQNQLDAVEGAQYRADLNAGANDGDPAKAVRQQINSLLKSKQAMSKLQAYRSDMEKVAQGTLGLNALRKAANLTGGTGGWHSGPWWLGALLAEPVSGTLATTMAAMPFVGMGLKRLETAKTIARVNALKARIAANAQGIAPQMPLRSPWPARVIPSAIATNGNQQ
jgi:hypothetical protein